MRGIRKRLIVVFIGILMLGVLSLGCVLTAASAEKTTVTLLSPFPNPSQEPWTTWVSEILGTISPEVNLKVTTAPWATIKDKLMPAIAAGNPPDIVQLGRPVFEWAARGYAEPLDELVEADPEVNPADWYPGVWGDMLYKGHVYALPFESDSMVFYWNKDYFIEAGLDPEKSPKTWSELDLYTEKLTEKDATGKYKIIGFIPWDDRSQEFMHWGWKNGGKFYDPETGRITAADPQNVKALEWEVSYAKKYGATKISTLLQATAAAGPGGKTINSFTCGLTAMMAGGSFSYSQMDKYAPHINYDMTPYLPIPEGGRQAGISAGTLIFVPTGAKGMKEYPEAVWEVMKWYSIVAMPLWCYQVGDLVSRPEYANLWMFASDWKVNVSVEALAFSHPWPSVPVLGFYRDELIAAVEYAIYGQKTPKQALEDVEKSVQAELERIVK
ncbi:hypothetical protein CEE34_02320 [Candidatus Aerophobetes bacterium Ae_b3a]|nr:MAG: hypothetical protein CEE34_02320 [Candidatus Aerophobetes bacterium Ae_b3a]